MVFGRDQASHDHSLHLALQRLHNKGLTLNADKCIFSVPKVVFHGHTFTDAGVSPDPHKVTTIHDMAAPSNAGELRSLLELTNYVSPFIPNCATVTAPLRDLTGQSAEWSWSDKHNAALEHLNRSCRKIPWSHTMTLPSLSE